jgi:hypothetical protein
MSDQDKAAKSRVRLSDLSPEEQDARLFELMGREEQDQLREADRKFGWLLRAMFEDEPEDDDSN